MEILGIKVAIREDCLKGVRGLPRRTARVARRRRARGRTRRPRRRARMQRRPRTKTRRWLLATRRQRPSRDRGIPQITKMMRVESQERTHLKVRMPQNKRRRKDFLWAGT